MVYVRASQRTGPCRERQEEVLQDWRTPGVQDSPQKEHRDPRAAADRFNYNEEVKGAARRGSEVTNDTISSVASRSRARGADMTDQRRPPPRRAGVRAFARGFWRDWCRIAAAQPPSSRISGRFPSSDCWMELQAVDGVRRDPDNTWHCPCPGDLGRTQGDTYSNVRARS